MMKRQEISKLKVLTRIICVIVPMLFCNVSFSQITLTQAKAVLMMDSKIQTQSKRIVLLTNTLTREQAVSDSLSSVVVLSNKAKTDLSRAYDFQTDQTDALKKTIVTMKRKHNAFKGLAVTTLTATILGLLLIK